MGTRQFAAAGAVSALVVTVGLLGATRIGLSGQTAGSRPTRQSGHRGASRICRASGPPRSTRRSSGRSGSATGSS